MGQREELLEQTIRLFEPLVERHGFRPPTVATVGRSTHLDYLSTELGVEIEFDWREFQAFVLLVRLEGGELPDGYYVANGRTVRKHLKEVFRKRAWAMVDWGSRQPSEEDIIGYLTDVRDMLLPRIRELLELGETLF
ncbi:MAG: hypothetical protein AAGA48_04370 [Myxococcota bacterium]